MPVSKPQLFTITTTLLKLYQDTLLYFYINDLLEFQVQNIPKHTTQIVPRFIKPLSQAYHDLASVYTSNNSDDVRSVLTKFNETFTRLV